MSNLSASIFKILTSSFSISVVSLLLAFLVSVFKGLSDIGNLFGTVGVFSLIVCFYAFLAHIFSLVVTFLFRKRP